MNFNETSNGNIMEDLVARGLAKPVSFSNIGKGCNGVPPPLLDWWRGEIGFTMEIPISLPLFQRHIAAIFSGIDDLRFSWDNDMCIWFIEYRTPPLEHNKSIRELFQIRRGRECAAKAAELAAARFHYPVEFENIWNDQDDESIGWGKMELRIYTDKAKNGLYIHLNKMTGDSNARWLVWQAIYPYFAGNTLLSRMSFVQFAEGIARYDEVTGVGAYDDSNPNERYLFNYFVVKELCTLLDWI